ncbi:MULTISPECIES: helix-turn-helix domain-containing protein [unclassified Flavobacterium]|uniref:helix-turn-helix domain-containing protein n=1 Tax=unclassified Flavobacterium TaxID=196869 RepID=UPI0025C13D61|nr:MULTISPECIES: helix-turn-helix domain-containing protein [unclassified Flavobacterium]
MESNQQNLFSKQPLTQSDLQEFKNSLIIELKELILHKSEPKKWMKSAEVRTLLNISPGTLQNFRINGTLNFNRIGGIIYYKYEDILKILNQ